jgi:hypothetical protein
LPSFLKMFQLELLVASVKNPKLIIIIIIK